MNSESYISVSVEGGVYIVTRCQECFRTAQMAIPAISFYSDADALTLSQWAALGSTDQFPLNVNRSSLVVY